MTRIYSIILCLTLCMFDATAQKKEHKALIWSNFHDLEYEIKAGINIGGTSPLPLPKEIRSIDGYSPTLSFSIEGSATKWLGETRKWGTSLGIGFESKGMTTKASVKNYNMEILSETGGKIKGLWTGGVKTKVKMSCFTIPFLANYRISQRWALSAGPYLSILMEKEFSGHVYEGHLRTPDASGSRVNFTDGNIAIYDFSENMRNLQWGLQVGGEWQAYKHLNVHLGLHWGLNDIFKKNFNTVTFAMYPIYMNLGFGYQF